MGIFAGSRVFNLIKLELLLHRRFYTMIGFGGFLLIFLYFTYYINKFRYHSIPNWENQLYNSTYIPYLIAAVFIVISQSFMDLRASTSAERYLLIPASALEKLVSQFVVKFGFTVLVLPLVFWLSAVLSRWMSLELIYPWLGGNQEVMPISFEVLWPLRKGQILSFYLFFYGVFMFIPAVLFTGSFYFGKWNIILTPLFFILFGVLLVFTAFGIQNLVFEGFRYIGDILDYSWQVTFYGEQVPLIILILIALFYIGTIVSYWISYHKLKEREV